MKITESLPGFALYEMRNHMRVPSFAETPSNWILPKAWGHKDGSFNTVAQAWLSSASLALSLGVFNGEGWESIPPWRQQYGNKESDCTGGPWYRSTEGTE